MKTKKIDIKKYINENNKFNFQEEELVNINNDSLKLKNIVSKNYIFFKSILCIAILIVLLAIALIILNAIFWKKIPVYFISIGIILGIFSGFSWKGNVRIRNSRGIKIEILRKSIDLIKTWYDEKLIVQNSDIYPIAIEAIFNPDKVYKGLNIKYKIIKTIQKSKDSMYNSKNDTYMWFTIPYTFFEFIYEFTKYHLEVKKKISRNTYFFMIFFSICHQYQMFLNYLLLLMIY